MTKSYRNVTKRAKLCPFSADFPVGGNCKKAALTFRNANASDIWDILAWRNSPQARKYSFKHTKISRAEHKSWLLEKFKDKRAKIYIAESNHGNKIGQVRFDKKGSFAEISVCLNPKHYGKGYGSVIIGNLTRRYLSENRRVAGVKATIIVGNEASKKAFKKAGYIISYYGNKDGERMLVMRADR